MTTPNGPRAKRDTRNTLSSRRDEMPAAERAAASARIATALEPILASRAAGTPTPIVALYAAKGSEVDTTLVDAAARARGYAVAYPRVVPGQRVLAFHLATPGELVLGSFGLREPRDTAKTVELAALRVICLPGIAFDRDGTRLGWGRGYYDATLAALPAPSDPARPTLLGLAYECQLVERLPRDPHDIAVDAVITERPTDGSGKS